MGTVHECSERSVIDTNRTITEHPVRLLTRRLVDCIVGKNGELCLCRVEIYDSSFKCIIYTYMFAEKRGGGEINNKI